MKNSSSTVARDGPTDRRSSARGERTIRAGICAAALVEERVVLERGVEVALAVEDRDGDVAAAREERLELVGRRDRDRVEAGLAELGDDGDLLLGRKGDDDGRTGHRWAPDSGCRTQAGAFDLVVGLGVVGGDVERAVADAGDPGLEARQARDRVAQRRRRREWLTAKRNSPSGPDETPTDWTPGEAAEMALEAGDAGDADEPDDDDLGRLRLGERRLVGALARDEPGEAGGERVVADLRDLLAVAAAGVGRAAASASAASKSGDRPRAATRGSSGSSLSSSWWPMISIAMSATASARAAASVATSALAAASAAAWIAANAASRSSSKSLVDGARPRRRSSRRRLGGLGVGLDRLGRPRRSRRVSTRLVDGRLGLGGRLVGRLGSTVSTASATSATASAVSSVVSVATASAGSATTYVASNMSSNGGGSGRFSAIVAKWVGSSSARRRSKKCGHLLLEARRRVAWTCSISRSIIAACSSISVSSRALRVGDLGLGLLADPGDLGLRPLADGGDVVVGLAAEVGGLGRRAGVDLLDVGLGVGLELGQGRGRAPPRRRPASPSSGRP